CKDRLREKGGTMKQKEQMINQEPESAKAAPVDENEPIPIIDRRRFASGNETEVDAPDAETERYPSYVEELQQRLKQAEEQAEKLQTRFKEAKNDLNRETDELRARLQRNAEARLDTAKGDLFARLLDVVDNLERAIKSARQSDNPTLLLEGVE